MARRVVLSVLLLWAMSGVAEAQTIGTFRFQLRPYCNVVTLTVVQQGGQYQVDGFDDQCGSGPAPTTGLAVFAGGGLTFGLTIVPSPAGGPVTVDASLNLGTLSGVWRDSADGSGVFVLIPGAGSGGSPRPPTAAGDISGVTAGAGLTGGALSGAAQIAVDFTATQQRVTGSCPAGQLMTAVNQNGSVACQSVSGSGGGDITSVSAGAGLTGGAATGDATLAVNFAGTGITAGVARADHWHQLAGNQNVGTGNSVLGNNTGSNNTALGFQAIAMGAGNGSDNTAVGNQALHLNTSGGFAVAVGSRALFSNTTGGGNTAVGADALRLGVTGSWNTAIGEKALEANVSDYNTAVGNRALSKNTNGIVNTALGAWAGQATTTGGYNLAAGALALFSNTSGGGNAALGTEALYTNVAGEKNSAVGEKALYAATGSFNVAVGNRAMTSTTTGASNTAVGTNALDANTTGGSNVAVGSGALGGSTTASNSTAVGLGALSEVTSGGDNIGVGFNAGLGLTTGTGNIYLGGLAGSGSESNTIRLGTGQTAAYLAGVSGATSASGVAVFVNGSGKLGTATSSRRFKEEIAGLGDEALARLRALRPVSFVYKPEFDDGSRQRQYGLVAEEVAEVFPELVVRDADGQVQTVRYHFLAPLLLAEVQRLERERAAAEAERGRLEERIRRLEETAAAVARR